MRQKTIFLMLSIILSLVNPGYVISDEVHGLSIGFDDGAVFNYTILSGLPQDDYYIVVNEVGPIPDNFTSYSQVSMDFTGYWANGTEFPLNYDMIFFWNWIPIGNWTYVKFVFGYTDPATVNWIDTDELFGIDNSVPGTPSVWSFWKADGALYEIYTLVGGADVHIIRTDVTASDTSTNDDTSDTSGSTTTTDQTDSTESSPPELSGTLIIAIGGVAAILIVVVIIMKKH